MDELRQERRARREARGLRKASAEGGPKMVRDPAAMGRIKEIRTRLDELAAERGKLREELKALRGTVESDVAAQ